MILYLMKHLERISDCILLWQKMMNILDVCFYEILLVQCVDEMDLGIVFVCSKTSDFVHGIFETMARSSKSLAT